MARPIKNNADYFSHDADMRNDLKVKALRRKFKHTGFSIYNMLLEVLTDSDYFEYELSDMNYEMLAGDFDIDTEELIKIITYIVSIDLMQLNNGLLVCKTLNNRLNPLLSKRKRERIEVIVDDNTHSKVKESKVKESKKEEQKNLLVFSDYENLENELLQSDDWIITTALRHNTDIDTIKGHVRTFCLDQRAKETGGRLLGEIKRHFVNWVGKEIDKDVGRLGAKKNGKEFSYREIIDMISKGEIKSIADSTTRLGENKYILKR